MLFVQHIAKRFGNKVSIYYITSHNKVMGIYVCGGGVVCGGGCMRVCGVGGCVCVRVCVCVQFLWSFVNDFCGFLYLLSSI